MKTLPALFAVMLPLAGCVAIHTETTAKYEPLPSGLEAVYSASANKAGLAVRVSSNGCTKAEDFAVTVDRSGSLPVVTIRRTRQDPCRAIAIGGTVVAFDYEAIGISGDFRLANPLARWNGPGE